MKRRREIKKYLLSTQKQIGGKVSIRMKMFDLRQSDKSGISGQTECRQKREKLCGDGDGRPLRSFMGNPFKVVDEAQMCEDGQGK